LNTGENFSTRKLCGHVVLLHFWTYSCINSIHVMPDLDFLENKYGDKPFIIIGVHSAKFHNEQDGDNVRAAVSRYEIKYPVVVDAGHKIWRAYGVRAWPTFVLIDSTGRVVTELLGEGRRRALDRLIGEVLKQGKRGKTLAARKYEAKPLEIPGKQLSFPVKLAMDEENRVLYISDSNHHQIVEAALETPARARVLHRIGSGKKGLTNGGYSKAAFNRPWGLAYHQGVLYAADSGNHAIRAVDLEKQKVKTLAGNGKQGDIKSPNSPRGLVFLDDNLYIAMAGNNQLYRLGLRKKKLELMAGNGYKNLVDGSAFGSSLAQPSGITAGGGKLYIADSDNSALRYTSLENGSVKTLIGQGPFKYGFKDGTFAGAYLQHPLGVFYSDHNVYIADTFNHALRAANIQTGEVRTLIKRSSKTTCTIPGSQRQVVPLHEPGGLLVYKDCIYIADTGNHLVRVYDIAAKTLETLVLVE
jgi:thiol-disulfide isomerase/thioredoxin